MLRGIFPPAVALVFLPFIARNTAIDIAAMGEARSLLISGRSHEHALIFASASVIRMRYAAIIRRADSSRVFHRS
jgi:hypothetical protein